MWQNLMRRRCLQMLHHWTMPWRPCCSFWGSVTWHKLPLIHRQNSASLTAAAASPALPGSSKAPAWQATSLPCPSLPCPCPTWRAVQELPHGQLPSQLQLMHSRLQVEVCSYLLLPVMQSCKLSNSQRACRQTVLVFKQLQQPLS